MEDRRRPWVHLRLCTHHDELPCSTIDLGRSLKKTYGCCSCVEPLHNTNLLYSGASNVLHLVVALITPSQE